MEFRPNYRRRRSIVDRFVDKTPQKVDEEMEEGNVSPTTQRSPMSTTPKDKRIARALEMEDEVERFLPTTTSIEVGLGSKR